MAGVTETLFSVNDDNTSNVSLKDQNFAKLLEEIYSVNNIDIKTDLSQRQVNAITKGKLFATTFNCDIMMNLCNLHETLLISKNRAGRKEFIEMSKSVTNTDQEESSIRDRLLGK